MDSGKIGDLFHELADAVRFIMKYDTTGDEETGSKTPLPLPSCGIRRTELRGERATYA